MKTIHNYQTVARQFGFTPEFFNVVQNNVINNREGYPLRPGTVVEVSLISLKTMVRWLVYRNLFLLQAFKCLRCRAYRERHVFVPCYKRSVPSSNWCRHSWCHWAQLQDDLWLCYCKLKSLLIKIFKRNQKSNLLPRTYHVTQIVTGEGRANTYARWSNGIVFPRRDDQVLVSAVHTGPFPAQHRWSRSHHYVNSRWVHHWRWRLRV